MAKVIVQAQWYENKAFEGGGEPRWSTKPAQDLVFDIDSDVYMYDKELVVRAVKDILNARSNSYGKYEYIGMEIDIMGTEDITAAFKDRYNDLAMSRYSEEAEETERRAIEDFSENNY